MEGKSSKEEKREEERRSEKKGKDGRVSSY